MPNTEVFYLPKGFEIMGNLSASYDVDMALKYGVEVAALYNKLEYLARYTTREDGYCWRTAEELEKEIGLSKKQQALAIKKLENAGLIYTKVTYIQGTQKRSKHFFVVGTSSPESYQTSLSEIPESNQTEISESYQTSLSESAESNFLYNNNQTVINKHNNIKEKNKKEKPIKHKHGEYNNVLLSDAEFEKLKAEFPNDYQSRIERLSGYMQSTGKSYKDHLATIRNWARRDNNNGYSKPSYSQRNYSQPVQQKREETEEERQQRVHEQYLRAMEAFGIDPNEKFDDDL
jgi:DNA-binding transcriptional regulator GbsR (MarR family)